MTKVETVEISLDVIGLRIVKLYYFRKGTHLKSMANSVHERRLLTTLTGQFIALHTFMHFNIFGQGQMNENSFCVIFICTHLYVFEVY